MEEIVRELDEHFKLGARYYENVGVSGHIEISHTWSTLFNSASRIELLKNWIDVLENQMILESHRWMIKVNSNGNE